MHCSLQEHSFAISLLRSLRSRRIPPLPTLCHLKAQLYCSAHSEWAEERQFYDNHRAGGLCIRVDLGTAELDSVAFDYFGNKYTEHPDTGLVFAGQKIPFLKDMISVCIKAANSLPSIPSIGWDVSCGENGPIIIEANYQWGLRTIQYPNGGIADIIYDRLGIRL